MAQRRALRLALALAALGLLTQASAASPPGITLSPNTTNRINAGAWMDTVFLRPLGPSLSVEACGALCAAWRPTASMAAQAQRCRSFTRFADGYTANTSLVGHCFGRVDPSWVPLDATGGDAADSGTVDWPCADSLDCRCFCTKTDGFCTIQMMGFVLKTMGLQFERPVPGWYLRL